VNPSIFQFHIILVVKIFSNCKDDIPNSLFERIGLNTTILFLYLQEVPSSLCATNTTLFGMDWIGFLDICGRLNRVAPY
jgi:hypothetical protein